MNTGMRKEIIKAKNNQTLDLKVLESKGIDILHSKIYFLGIELTGGNESQSQNNECFFGEIDSKDEFIESKPIYHLIGEIDSNSIESTSNNRDSNNSLSTLQVCLGSNTLTLLNYSLLDSSLNIKLESTSTESKEILEREKAQREKQKEQDSQTKDSITSTAFLHPILEDNELKCPHNGVVKLKSNKGKNFKSKDILNKSIINHIVESYLSESKEVV